MAPRFLISRALLSTILIPKDTSPDGPSTTNPPDKTPGTTTALHIILAFVLVGIFISLLAWMKHKFRNPTMVHHAGGSGRATLPPTPSHDSTSTGHGIPDRYSSPPPIPHPRRGIKQSHPPPRPVRPPPLVTNEESFKAATPRQEPSASRHDFASSTEPSRHGSPVKRRGGGGRGQSGQFLKFPPTFTAMQSSPFRKSPALPHPRLFLPILPCPHQPSPSTPPPTVSSEPKLTHPSSRIIPQPTSLRSPPPPPSQPSAWP